MPANTPRPLLHFTPPADWMNDPNGLVYLDGVWHLFYQYQPADSEHKHWGHAVSGDLLHWEHWPVALFPDKLGAIWSGSCVVDRMNTSVFFPDGEGLVAIFTHYQHSPEGGTQSQSLAYSRDSGRTWTKYEGNPVLPSNRRDFRDPKVFWHTPDKHWVMVVAAGEQVELYSSTDLKTWGFASAFGAGRAPGRVWECPDLFPVRDEQGHEVWILLSSFLEMKNFEGEFGACYAAYFPGRFDGETFTADEDGSGRRVSFGPDDYAPVTFSDAPGGRRVLIGWLNHWGYAGPIGTVPWQGQMTLPRELHWRNGALVQSLPPELEAARFWPCIEMAGNAVRFDETPWGTRPAAARRVVAARSRAGGKAGFFAGMGRRTARLDDDAPRRERTTAFQPKVGLSEFFTAPHDAPATPATGETHIVVDACSVEAFCDGGRTLFCLQIFPPGGGWEIAVSA